MSHQRLVNEVLGYTEEANMPGKTGIPTGVILLRGTGAGADGLFGGRGDSLSGMGAGGLSEGCGGFALGNIY